VLLGFSTGSEFITLPLIIEGVRKLFENKFRNGVGDVVAVSHENPIKEHNKERIEEGFGEGIEERSLDRCEDDLIRSSDDEDIQSYSEVLVPVAYTFPLLGAFVPFLFILFVAWLYMSPLDLSEQIKLIAV
jgi:Na+/H+-dicarboxylate symporter